MMNVIIQNSLVLHNDASKDYKMLLNYNMIQKELLKNKPDSIIDFPKDMNLDFHLNLQRHNQIQVFQIVNNRVQEIPVLTAYGDLIKKYG